MSDLDSLVINKIIDYVLPDKIYILNIRFGGGGRVKLHFLDQKKAEEHIIKVKFIGMFDEISKRISNHIEKELDLAFLKDMKSCMFNHTRKINYSDLVILKTWEKLTINQKKFMLDVFQKQRAEENGYFNTISCNIYFIGLVDGGALKRS